jgi:hypothetical protein
MKTVLCKLIHWDDAIALVDLVYTKEHVFFVLFFFFGGGEGTTVNTI